MSSDLVVLYTSRPLIAAQVSVPLRRSEVECIQAVNAQVRLLRLDGKLIRSPVVTGNVTRGGRAPHQARLARRAELRLILGAPDPIDLRNLELVDSTSVGGSRDRERYLLGRLSRNSLESAVDPYVGTCSIGFLGDVSGKLMPQASFQDCRKIRWNPETKTETLIELPMEK